MPVWLLSGALWKLIGAAVLAAFMWWAWGHFVANPYIAEGVAKESVKTAAEKNRADEAEAANAKLADQKRALQTAYADQTAAMLDLSKATAAKLAAKEALVKAHAVTESALQTELKTLKAVTVGPPSPTKQEACDEATRLLDAYAAGQLRK